MNDPVQFPILAETRYESNPVLSYRDLLNQIMALENIKNYQRNDWDKEQEEMLRALETLKALCKENGCVDSNS